MNDKYIVKSNVEIADNVFRMVIIGNTKEIQKPGQFLNIKIDDDYQNFLRRPISISSYVDNEITIIYKLFGVGTEKLSKKVSGDILDILCPLGNGFSIKPSVRKALLIGGGVGVPPLYQLAIELKNNNIPFDIVMGFSSKKDVFLETEFNDLAENVFVCTMDGTYKDSGSVIDVIKNRHLDFDYYYACGPEAMLHALVKERFNGQLSFEERMGCGFGACMGCSHKTIKSYKRICREGPVLESDEVYIDE